MKPAMFDLYQEPNELRCASTAEKVNVVTTREELVVRELRKGLVRHARPSRKGRTAKPGI
jgi:hypothetical protein